MDYSSPDAMNDRRLVTILVLIMLAPLNVWAQASMPAATGVEAHDASAATSTGHGHHDHMAHAAVHIPDHGEVHEQVHGEVNGKVHDEMHKEMHGEMHNELHEQMHEETEESQSSGHVYEHDSDDCDEYCMNCSNHCSSTAIVTTAAHPFMLNRKFSRAASANLSTRATLLFRPPIHS